MFIAGPYFWEYGTLPTAMSPLGVVQDAVRIRRSIEYDEIIGDNLGETIQALVYRGGNTFIDMVFLEWDKNAVQFMAEPFGQVLDDGARWGQIGQTAVNVSNAGEIELTSNLHSVGLISADNTVAPLTLLGTAMAGQEPTYIRAENAILAPGQNSDVLFGSRSREIPVSFLSLPWVEPNVDGTDPKTASSTVFTVRFTNSRYRYSS